MLMLYRSGPGNKRHVHKDKIGRHVVLGTREMTVMSWRGSILREKFGYTPSCGSLF